MLSPLIEKSRGRQLSEEDIPMMKHQFRKVYGWITPEQWDDIPMNELLEDYKFVQEEIKKQEELRFCTLKFYGVKNPK